MRNIIRKYLNFDIMKCFYQNTKPLLLGWSFSNEYKRYSNFDRLRCISNNKVNVKNLVRNRIKLHLMYECLLGSKSSFKSNKS